MTHLNTQTFDVRGARLVRGHARPFDGAIRCVTHCLLIETERHGLVLVDIGLGGQETADPGRVPAPVRFELRPSFARRETAREQLAALGHDPRDVRHVVFTHLDLDHAAGLSDFPDATAHVLSAELSRATSTRRLPQRLRYASTPLRAHRRWHTYDPGDEDIAGLPGVRPIERLAGEVAFVPLPGHSHAHAGVAVRTRSGWLLHAGDAYLHRDELDSAAPPGLHQRLVETSSRARSESVERLREARAELSIVCSHDAAEFDSSVGAPGGPPAPAGDETDRRRAGTSQRPSDARPGGRGAHGGASFLLARPSRWALSAR